MALAPAMETPNASEGEFARPSRSRAAWDTALVTSLGRCASPIVTTVSPARRGLDRKIGDTDCADDGDHCIHVFHRRPRLAEEAF